jgi:5-formyltetrahydrofolate cyclo-ligase
MHDDVSAAKSTLRKRIVAQRDALNEDTRRELSKRITAHLLTLSSLRDASCVMAYANFGSEFDTSALLSYVITSGKQLILPRVDRVTRTLQTFRVTDTDRDLQRGSWGIHEPAPEYCTRVSDDAVQFVLVPGLAFTQLGKRLGYGGGFYDQFIARLEHLSHRPTFIAAAFSLQVVDDIPMTGSDRKIGTLVTEHGPMNC